MLTIILVRRTLLDLMKDSTPEDVYDFRDHHHGPKIGYQDFITNPVPAPREEAARYVSQCALLS